MDTFEARKSEETPEALLDQMCCCMQLVVVGSAGEIASTAHLSSWTTPTDGTSPGDLD
jgi:hypothetical protein